MAEPKYSQEQWEALLASSIAEINRLATLKGGEYAGDVDRLANFRRNGAGLGLPMEGIWAVYAGKHWDAIQQYCKDIVAGKERQRAEPISGRLDDLIVYALLMKAMVEEREPRVPGAAKPPSYHQMKELYRQAGILREATPPSPPPALRLVPSCPSISGEHSWGSYDRWTEQFRYCGNMRPKAR